MAGEGKLAVTQDAARILFLNAQSASGSGPWFDVSQWRHKSFTADAIEASGKVEIMVSNAAAQPASGTDGPVIKTLDPAVAGGLAVSTDDAFKWMKCKKTAGTPAATTVIAMLMGGTDALDKG